MEAVCYFAGEDRGQVRGLIYLNNDLIKQLIFLEMSVHVRISKRIF